MNLFDDDITIAEHEIVVRLSDDEIAAAVQGAKLRWQRVLKDNLTFAPGQREFRDGKHEQDHVVGAVAEYAYCKYKGVAWSPTLDSTAHGDLNNVEIKASYLEQANLLIPITYQGATHLSYVLAVVARNHRRVTFVGWIPGDRALTSKYWAPFMPLPCWLVPRGDLLLPRQAAT